MAHSMSRHAFYVGGNHPSKQGLKLNPGDLRVADETCRGESSIKTRIETQRSMLYDSLEWSRGESSIKTRIETFVRPAKSKSQY